MCVYCVCAWWLGEEGTKKMLDSLEPKLEIVMSHHMDAGNRTWVFSKSNLNHLFRL